MRSRDADTKLALVTGAASGIGAAFAARLAQRSYSLWLIDKDSERLAAVCRDLQARHGIDIVPIVADLRKEADQDAVIEVIANLPALSLLINNAGFGEPGTFHELPPESHESMLQVHVMAPVRFSRAAVPAMIACRKGTIINVCSLMQYVRVPGNTMYGTTKTFLYIFSQQLRLDVQRHGIEVQALIPGYTRSGFGNTEAYRNSRRDEIPSVLWLSAEDVVDASLGQLGSGCLSCVPGRINRIIEFFLRHGLYSARLLRRWLA